MEKFDYPKSKQEHKDAILAAQMRLNKTLGKPPLMHDENSSSLTSRVALLAAERKNESNVKPANEKEKPLGLADMAKKEASLEKKMQKEGIEPRGKKLIEKDDPKKDKDLTKDEKNKDEKAKEDEKSPAKQEEKAREMISKVKLPSGMEIHQEGPSWILTSKDGKVHTNVTSIMNKIDKFNQDVDEANKNNSVEKNVQNNADQAAAEGEKDGIKKGDMSNEDMSKDAPTFSTDQKISAVEQALPEVKDIDGNQVFDEKDLRTVAELAIHISDEKLLEKMQDKERKTNRTADEKTAADKKLSPVQLAALKQREIE